MNDLEVYGFDKPTTDRVKEMVRNVMTKETSTRNNDNTLIRRVWHHYGTNIPASTITRVRREIQNDEHQLIPTDPKVIRLRLNKQQEFMQRALNRIAMKNQTNFEEVYGI